MSANYLTDEKQLLIAVAGGDRLAFGQLYEHYRRKVYFIAFQLLQSVTEAEDVQQDIFTKIWVHRSALGEINQFNSYLNTLIRNHVYNGLRKKASATTYLHELLNRTSTDDAFENSELNELQGLLQQAIVTLPPQQKKVFQLVRIEGRQHAEVAALIGISKGTVKKHMMEAQRNITAFLKPGA